MAELSNVSREYFSDLNPTATRIFKDITQFSCLLGDRWSTLPEHEKDCLIDDHIVPPDIRDHYGDHWDAQQEEQYYPKFILKSGGGVVVDTDGETWDDEHSGPFSWETNSQNELSLDELLTDKPRQHLKDPKRCKSPSRGGGVGGGSGAASGAAAARSRTSAVLFDSSPVGGGTDFDHLRSMWEQGNVTSAAAAGGPADDDDRIGTSGTSAGPAADAVDGQPRASGAKASTPSAADSSKEFSAAARGRPAASASGTLPAAPNRFPATLPRQSDPRQVGTLPGKAATGMSALAAAGTTVTPASSTTVTASAVTTVTAAAAAVAVTVVTDATSTAVTAAAAAAASEVAAASSTASATMDVAAAAGGGGSVMAAAANVNDDPVFQQHRVTFGSARPPTAAGRGGRTRPRSGGYKTGTAEAAGFYADGAGDSVKTGFDFLDDW